jgi:hypothetical protein
MIHSVPETSSAMLFGVFPLQTQMSQRHLGGTIISAIQFDKAWTSFIAFEVMFQTTNDPLGA